MIFIIISFWVITSTEKERNIFFFKEEKVFEKEGLLTPPLPSVKK